MEIVDNIVYRPDLSEKYDDQQSLGHLIIENLMKAGNKVMVKIDQPLTVTVLTFSSNILYQARGR